MSNASVGGDGALRGVVLGDGGDVGWKWRDRNRCVIWNVCIGMNGSTTDPEVVQVSLGGVSGFVAKLFFLLVDLAK